MIGFLLKKAFWDTWDNMGRVLLVNLIMIGLASIPVFLPKALSSFPFLSIISLILGLLLIFLFAGGASRYIKDLVYYEPSELKDLFGYVKLNAKQSLIFGVLILAFLFICYTGFSFYGRLGNLMGLFGAAILFWITFIAANASVFFFPVLNTLNREIPIILKKCFILLFDNAGTAFLLLLGVLFNSVLSVLLALILPGIGGILILLESAMKLLMLKYDYLEENPQENRKKIPWTALLRDEKEKIGKRTLKGTIFPWKD